jgi:glycosyltransferase involved in cell wall biosynthesis
MIPSVEIVLARPLQHLADQGLLEFQLVLMGDARLIDVVAEFDLLLLMRCCQPEALALVENARASGVSVIYAIDDDFEALDPESPLGAHYKAICAWENLLKICSKSSQVWAFSEALRQKIVKVQPHCVVPVAIANFELIDGLVSAILPRDRTAMVERKVIGYAASTYHSVDIDMIAPVLERLLAERPKLELEFVHVRCESLAAHPRVTHFGSLPSVRELYGFVLSRNWDVGLAPLVRSAANDAKTDNKYREYGSLNIPAVYSDAPPYWGSVIHEYNGAIASDTEGWYASLCNLLDDSTLASSIARHAREDVERRYSIEVVASRYFGLMGAAMSVPYKILVLAADIPTTDIDIMRPYSRLEAEGAIVFRVMTADSVSPEDMGWAQLLVIVRDVTADAIRVAQEARERFVVPVIFSWDDDFFTMPSSLGELSDYYHAPTTIAALKEMLTKADLVKASTARLAARSREYSRNVVQVPYGFDFSQLAGVTPRHRDESTVMIGFFGSFSHVRALDIVLSALKRVSVVAPHVHFQFFGPQSNELTALQNVRFIPYNHSSTESLRDLAALGWDIGLAPLEDNEFNRAKLPTKYRDYGACHIAGVYSKLDPFEAVVIEGQTGLLVDNTEEAWFEAIMSLVTDATKRRNMAAAAHAHVRAELSLDQAVEAWRGLLGGFFADDSDGDSKAAVTYKRKLQALESRVERLTSQVEGLKRASRILLSERTRPLSRSLGDRIRRRFLRMVPRWEGLPAACPGADIAVFATQASCDDQVVPVASIKLSANLQHVAFLEYPIHPHPMVGSIVQVALAATVPSLDGLFGLEIVNHADEIVFHATQSIAHINPNLIAEFNVGNLQVEQSNWRLRFFVRGSESPLFLYQWQDSAAKGGRRVLFRIAEG